MYPPPPTGPICAHCHEVRSFHSYHSTFQNLLTTRPMTHDLSCRASPGRNPSGCQLR